MPSGYSVPLGTNAHWTDAMNRVSSDVPSTISGVDMGRKTSRLVAPRPRNEWRTSASAMSTPMVVAMSVDERRDEQAGEHGLAQARPAQRVQPGVDGEALPGQVGAPGRDR